MSSNKSENYTDFRAELFKRFFDTDSYFFLCLSTSLQYISAKRANFREDDYFVIGKVIQVLVDSEDPAQTMTLFHELPHFQNYMSTLDDGIVRLQLPDLSQQQMHETIEGMAEEFVQSFAEIISDKATYKKLLKMLGVPPRRKVLAEENSHEEAPNGQLFEEAPAEIEDEIDAFAFEEEQHNSESQVVTEADSEQSEAAETLMEENTRELDEHVHESENMEMSADAREEAIAEQPNHENPSQDEDAFHNQAFQSSDDWQDLMREVNVPRPAAPQPELNGEDAIEYLQQNGASLPVGEENTALLTRRANGSASKDERIAEFRNEADLYFRVIDEAIEQLILNKQSRIAFENLELAAYSLKSVARKLGLEQLAKLPEQVEELIGKIVLLRVSPGNSTYITIKRTFAMIKKIRCQRDMENSEYRELSNSLLRLTRSMDELQQKKSMPHTGKASALRAQMQQNIDAFRMAEYSS